MLLTDKERATNYERIKPILDKCHIKYIDDQMSAYSNDWSELYEALISAQKDKNLKKDLEAVQKKYRTKISKFVKDKKKMELLAPKTLINNAIAGDYYVPEMKDNVDLFHSFNKFATYFTNYQQARDNMYKEDGSTAIAYRIVNEIFPQFVSNIKLFNDLSEEVKTQIEKDTERLLGVYPLNKIFSLEFFNNVLSQKGIDFYNSIIGGITASDGITKQKGVNESCNICYQQGLLNKKIVFKLLYKQILSDRETVSFVSDMFESDYALNEALKRYCLTVNSTLNNFVDDLQLVFSKENVDLDKIYVDKKMVPSLSVVSFDNDWRALKDRLANNGIKSKDEYALKELQQCSEVDLLEKVYKNIVELKGEILKAEELLQFNAKISSYVEIKNYMDLVQKLEKLLKIFCANDDNEKEPLFYGVHEKIYSVLRENIPLYNMIRNYATKAPYSTEKYKLNFDSPTLLDGWDQNKESSCLGMLFLKGGKYYLGIMNAKDKPVLSESDEKRENCYAKMVYKYLPGPNKMLPKVFFSKKGLSTFGASDYVLNNYNAKKHIKSEKNFDLKYCHDLIDYFKEKINEHPDWSKFGFKFSDTKDYENISDFYNEISKQAYQVSFSYVDDATMKKAVKDGKLYLFQIYNKDFSEKSTGNPNLHTIYWKELFTEENLKTPIFKLNGQAELFYRPSSIENPFVHKENSILIRKKDKLGRAVNEEIYKLAICDVENGATIDELEKKYPNLLFRKAPHDIVKDKRYAQERILFHVPITINNSVDEKYKKFNEAVLRHIEASDDFHIIGIDRGERNLIYISCIDLKGNIVYQRSFNVVSNTDYHEKLDSLEKIRLDERRNWEAVTKIKDVKSGYLSQVVHEIVKLMMKHPSIIVMEDLNRGFKQGRIHIEKQVYQNFEKALIDKLNYCMLKNLPSNQEGGARRAYQLSAEFESFERLGKQSGFIFYVPARNTSKIDFNTGFVNLFTSAQLKYESVNKSKEFIGQFDEICYDSLDCFRFDFKYSKFTLNQRDFKDSWSIYTIGEKRIAHTKIDGYDTTREVDVTEEMKQLFEKYGIDYTSNLKAQIMEVDDKSFFKTLLWLLSVTLQLRYENADNDFILSPVQKDGKFYDTRKASENEPCDGDANGAYHIALKGLQLVKTQIEDGKIIADEKGQQLYNFLKFAQSKDYQK
ncbi:MAG: type V CRISPR-associated protein Cas12a/Cpf1 [Clostridia bacterium]|nr:type V CRISPR-associated protein Cas12a/Cpf1 [Clostridia bacterium]